MELEDLRKGIDNIDEEIISMLAKRKDLTKGIALIKKELDKPVFDKGREQQLLEKIRASAKEKGLDKTFIISLYNIILKKSRDEQEEIIKK